jgi:hypothetical protein
MTASTANAIWISAIQNLPLLLLNSIGSSRCAVLHIANSYTYAHMDHFTSWVHGEFGSYWALDNKVKTVLAL